MTGKAQEKGSSVKGSVEQGSHAAKNKAHEKARATKEGAQEMAGTTEQAGGEAKQGAKQTSQGVMETVKDYATGAKEAVMGTAPSESTTYERRYHEGQDEPRPPTKVTVTTHHVGDEDVEQPSHGIIGTIKDYALGAKDAILGTAPNESSTYERRMHDS